MITYAAGQRVVTILVLLFSIGMSFTKQMIQPQPGSGETQGEILDIMSLEIVPGMKLIQQILSHKWKELKIKQGKLLN